ncbi:hypothetical protein M406DRAFT_49171 [Cryphonectria parasitica EP155]|uniref:Uncharacterized protein n=1 Tax=Cryphonectria parasitica (strain ATCC 38755 / EP155) TaxID=660469 RepID=A0A9P5CMZ2_CRYP1|nr:uncharacterized protein M406DRAFT_49171 [Cryphonectria parasitica EP155]KAF3763596.1 hypothetical protein M406DRAFT_49171 [Cryphonectria parasitica EP155]
MAHRSRHDPGQDPFSSMGYWGPPSSTANFCEEDYAITKYIAEFFNTFTNLAYVYYAFKISHRDARKGILGGMDTMALSLLFIGIFSFLFHATLHRETQFLDEMSMFFLGSALLQPLYTKGYAPRTQRTITIVLLSVVVLISAVYHQTRIVELHWGSFFIMENMLWTRALYLSYNRPRPEGAPPGTSKVSRQFWSSTGTMVVAITLWLIDLEFCPPLRALREAVGLPWAYLLELHGWWHILTAVAAAGYIKLIREICQ